MEEQKQLGTLEAMTKEIFLLKPDQAPSAIDEYKSQLNNDESTQLEAKLANTNYEEQFKVAITYTSFMVFIAALKAMKAEDNIKFDKYVAEYLHQARMDDKELYKMRLFYLSNLTGKEMGIGVYNGEEQLSEEEEALLNKEALRAQREYDQLIEIIKGKYMERSVYLMDN